MNDIKVQIDYSLLKDMYLLVIEANHMQNYDYELSKKIETQIYKKVEAMKRRELYTKVKTCNTQNERDDAIKKYIDLKNEQLIKENDVFEQ